MFQKGVVSLFQVVARCIYLIYDIEASLVVSLNEANPVPVGANI
jgi:hypothetical protein